MKHLFIILISFLLISCTSIQKENYQIKRYNSFIQIKELKGGNLNTLAYSEITGNHCIIYLRSYPKCLLHEVRHCFEDNWHEGIKTDKDC